MAGNSLSKMAASGWRAVRCSRRHLRLDTVLLCGQSFRWHEGNAGEWLGVLADRVWRLKQDETHVYFKVYGASSSSPSDRGNTRCETKTEIKPVVKLKKSGHHLISDGRHRNSSSMSEETFGQESGNCRHKSKIKSHESMVQQGLAKKVALGSEKDTKPNCSKSFCDHITGPVAKPEFNDGEDEVSLVSILEDYFQLGVDVDALYHQWSHADPYFRRTAADFWGIRILRQDPVENLFSFICSSNNNISRISSMVEKLCTTYGRPIAEVDGKMYYSFPRVSCLAQAGVEDQLRALGFGYRAKFIAKSARYIMDNHGEEWVSSLRQCSYEEAKSELMKLCGVGAKVADCVCLMSLDKAGAIPVDTHVWQFAARHYLPKLQAAKSVTDKLYKEIGDHFRTLWGEYAGWAQSVLFTSELRHMQSKKSVPDQSQMQAKAPTAARKRRGKRSVEGPVMSKYSKSSSAQSDR